MTTPPKRTLEWILKVKYSSAPLTLSFAEYFHYLFWRGASATPKLEVVENSSFACERISHNFFIFWTQIDDVIGENIFLTKNRVMFQ